MNGGDYYGRKREAANFIEAEINKDIANHVYANGRVLTRFPPEPNGYLHIGHVKSICLNFGLGEKYHGATNVRFDDTNPTKENQEFVDSILEDVKWSIQVEGTGPFCFRLFPGTL